MASISVRALDSTGEPLRGSGKANFLYDLDAVAQIVITRIKLFSGEWWEDITAGFPLFQSVLNNGNARNLALIEYTLQQVILGTPFVTSLANVRLAYSKADSALLYTVTVVSVFGTFTMTTKPANFANLDVS